MSKKIAEPVSEPASSANRVSFRNVLGLLYNPARPIERPEDRQKYPKNRDNVPWVVIIPNLSVVATVLDRDGDPITGHINPGYACEYSSRLYNRLVSDPKLLQSYRENPDGEEPETGYIGKFIPIVFQV